jgi:uncharacterized protein YegL
MSQQKSKKSGTGKPVWTHVLLDESGSMRGSEQETLQELNRTFDELPAESKITVIKFSSSTHVVVIRDAVPAEELKRLGSDEYVPTGSTAYNDAICLCINRCIDAKEAANYSHVVIGLTDGKENASQSTFEETVALIRKAQAKGWTFINCGAKQDTASNAAGYGFDANINYHYSGAAPEMTRQASMPLPQLMRTVSACVSSGNTDVLQQMSAPVLKHHVSAPVKHDEKKETFPPLRRHDARMDISQVPPLSAPSLVRTTSYQNTSVVPPVPQCVGTPDTPKSLPDLISDSDEEEYGESSKKDVINSKS